MGERLGPSRRDVRDRIIALMGEIAKIPPETIVDAATIDEELRMESVDFVELQVALEDEYQIEIDLLHVVELNQFSEIVDYIFNCASGNGA